MKVVTGMTFGKLTVRAVFQKSNHGPVNMRHKCRIECQCGTLMTIPIYYLIRKSHPKVVCGLCNPKSLKTLHKEEYRIWNMMHERTENPKHVSYHHYGGRGIRVCQEWNKAADDGQGFERFLRFVGPRPSPQHTIDRIDNDVGYQPYHNGKVQVKWSTGAEQRLNQRPYTNSKREAIHLNPIQSTEPSPETSHS